MDGWTEVSGLDGGVATDDTLVPVGENHREETPSVIDDRRDGADDEDESRTGADVLPESRRAVSHAIAPAACGTERIACMLSDPRHLRASECQHRGTAALAPPLPGVR